MQFKNPEILYLLFLLIIPVILHLFQLQKFEKVAFTNVKLLKEIKQQTRKSSRLKKILLLISRMLLLASLILAFSQPYFNKKNRIENKEIFVYLDNSFSMQAKGDHGELLQRAKNDLITKMGNKLSEITLVTNDQVYKNIQDKGEILQIAYSPIHKELKDILLQIEKLRDDKIKTPADILFISDFQKATSDFTYLKTDSLSDYYFIQMLPVQKENVSIDSVWINDKGQDNIQIMALIKSYHMPVKDVSVSLYMNKNLFGKTTISFDKNKSEIIEFTIPDQDVFTAKITLEDNRLQFDNTLFFNKIKSDKIPVLSIGTNNRFLEKIYNKDEFIFQYSDIKELDFSLLSKQKILLLNELKVIPKTLIQSLRSFKGNLVLIPSLDADLQTYNSLFESLHIGKITESTDTKQVVNNIQYKHPFFKNVFEKEINNFQYPTVNQYYTGQFFGETSLLKFSNGSDFLSEINRGGSKIYLFRAALNSENSNFLNSPLVVPVFYNFSLQSFKRNNLYYKIGEKNEIQIKSIDSDDVAFHLTRDSFDFIPLQSKSQNFVILQTEEMPLEAGVYSVTNNVKEFRKLSFNYQRNESDVSYSQPKTFAKSRKNVHYDTSVKSIVEQINDQNKNRNLWQLFIIFALIFMVFEVFIQKFFK